ncbi:MAG: acyltransferase [Verrucomicrobiota bacterium]
MNFRNFLLTVARAVKLVWLDARIYGGHLYKRAIWGRQGLTLSPSARFQYEHREQIQVKGRCHVGHYSILTVRSTKDTGDQPLLILENNIYIGDQVNLRATGGAISIGNDVMIADHVSIVASNHGTKLGQPMDLQDWQRGDVLIEEDVWIGAGAVVLPGSTVRRGAVIAAGAVVRGEVPCNAIYGGIPARQISVRA